MKKVVKVTFLYDDGTIHEIRDRKAALLFQARVNTGGVLSGIEHTILPPKKWWQKDIQSEDGIEDFVLTPIPGRSYRLNDLARNITKWREKKGFITNWENMPEKLMLAVTELSEAMEAYRKDDKINFNEEIADTFIRLCDITGSLKIDIEDEIQKKMDINKKRSHKHGKCC